MFHSVLRPSSGMSLRFIYLPTYALPHALGWPEYRTKPVARTE